MGKKLKKNGYVDLYNKSTGHPVSMKEDNFVQLAKIRMYSLKYGIDVSNITLHELNKILHDEW